LRKFTEIPLRAQATPDQLRVGGVRNGDLRRTDAVLATASACARLYGALYQQTFDQALPYSRTTKRRVNVRHDPTTIFAEGLADYAPKLIRALRDAAHDFVGGLETTDRRILAGHSGSMPQALADLAALLAIGALADHERFTQGYDAWFAES
jgi:hypothetical protein